MPWKDMDRARAYQRKWRKENKERLQMKAQAYYMQNRRRIRRRTKEWYFKNREAALEYSKVWYNKNKLRISRQREASRVLYRKRILELLGGGKCAHCKCRDWRVLQLDHINGDGYKNGRHSYLQIHGPTDMQKFLQKLPQLRKKLQVLCANCNWIKRHENRETGYRLK